MWASNKAHFPSAQASIQVDHVLVNVERKWAALPGPGYAVFSRQNGLTMSASDLRYKAGCSSLNLSLYLSRPRLIPHHRLDSAFEFEKWKSSEHTCAEHGLHSPYQPHALIPQLPPSSLRTFGRCCPKAQRSGDCSKQRHETKVLGEKSDKMRPYRESGKKPNRFRPVQVERRQQENV